MRRPRIGLVAVLAALLAASPASAFRIVHHADPARAFKAYKAAPRAHASAFTSTFAGDWPCAEATSDLAPAMSSNAPQVKLVYAYPTDTLDRTPTYAPLMQLDAKAIRDRLAGESSLTGTSTKTVRFDTGASGGTCTTPKNYLDIQTVALSHPASFYNSASAGASTFKLLTDELKAKLHPNALVSDARVNYVVYADRIEAGIASGEADIPLDDSKSLENPINQGATGSGRLFAVVYGNPAAATDPADFTGHGAGPRQATFLHELSHTLGAVQYSAPNSSGAGHCLDEPDIMCYKDSSNLATHVACTAAGATAGDFTELYDCNNDDYYNPNPPDGNYLATHWNTYDSVYLCSLTDCDSSLTPPGSASLATTHPNGVLALQASVASGTIAHYEWDVDGDGFYDTDTGTSPTLTPTWNSPGTRTVHVRASQADGTFSSAALSVTPAQPVPHFTISGPLVAGQALTLDGSGTEDPDGLITDFRWDLDGDNTYETDTGLTRTATTSFPTARTAAVGLEVDYRSAPAGRARATSRLRRPRPPRPAAAPLPPLRAGAGRNRPAGPRSR